jgi:hypothetical protein
MGRSQRQLAWCIWILGALLVVASVDATPDPPALAPHVAAVTVASPSGFAKAVRNPSGNHSSLNLLDQFQTQGPVFIGHTEPDYPVTSIAQMEQATDPSPPLFIES